MTKEIINVGIRANDGKGDTVRAAFIKTNNNFSELYTTVSNNANTGNSQFDQSLTLAQGAFNKANAVFLGDIKFANNLIYSNNTIEVGIDQSDKKAWAALFGQITTQNNSAYASSVTYDNEGFILAAMTTVNESTGLEQSTLVKYDTQGNIFWRKTVPTINSKPSFGESVGVDGNNNVYLLTNIPGEFSTLVTKFNYLGQNVWSSLITDAEYSEDLCVDSEGFCYFTGGHNLLTGLDSTGEILFTHFSPQAMNGRSCIVANGGVIVGSSNGFVHKFDTEGVYQWTTKVDGLNDDIDCLAYDSSNYYAATKSNSQIYKVAANNQVLWQKKLTGVTTPNIQWMKYKNGNLYLNGHTTDPDGEKAFITYKLDSNGSLLWSKSLQVEGANGSLSFGHRQIDVSNNYFTGVGYCDPSSNVQLALTYQLPIDGSLSGSYIGSNGSYWGSFTYVNVPEANTITSTTGGAGNTVITISVNTDYSYTLENLVYSSTSGVYENDITYFIQEWKYDPGGSITLPGSGDKTGIDMSDKDIINVANVSFIDGTKQSRAFTIGRTIPTTSVGASGDKQGDMAANSSYLYYCVETHSGNANNIWKRVSWSNDTW
jgi:hypothetical protein